MSDADEPVAGVPETHDAPREPDATAVTAGEPAGPGSPSSRGGSATGRAASSTKRSRSPAAAAAVGVEDAAASAAAPDAADDDASDEAADALPTSSTAAAEEVAVQHSPAQPSAEAPAGDGDAEAAETATDSDAQQVREDTAARLDHEREAAHLEKELARSNVEMKAVQRQLAAAQALADSRGAALGALTKRCHELEDAATATAEPGPVANAAAEVPRRAAGADTAAVANAVAVATARTQSVVLRLEATSRANVALAEESAFAKLRADSAAREAAYWRTAASLAASTAAGGSTGAPLTSATPTNGDGALQAAAERSTAAALVGVEDAAKRFVSLLDGTCALLEDKATVAATAGDWRTVLREVHGSAQKIIDAHVEAMRQHAKERKDAVRLAARAEELEATLLQVTGQLRDASLPNVLLRAAVSQSAAGSPALLGAGMKQDPISVAAAAACGSTTASPAPSDAPSFEVRMLRFALQQSMQRAERLERMVRQLTESTDQLATWATSVTRETLAAPPAARGVVVPGTSGGGVASSSAVVDGVERVGDMRRSALEAVCEQWARRAMIASRLLVDDSLRVGGATASQNPHLEAQVVRLQGLLAAERASSSELRHQLQSATAVAALAHAILCLPSESAADACADQESVHAVVSALGDMRDVQVKTAQAHDDVVARVEGSATEHLRQVDELGRQREGRHLVTISFLQNAAALADRAVLALLGRPLPVSAGPQDKQAMPHALQSLNFALHPSLAQAASASSHTPGSTAETAAKAAADAATVAIEGHLGVLAARDRSEENRLRRRIEVLESLTRTQAAQRVLELEGQLDEQRATTDSAATRVSEAQSALAAVRGELDSERATAAEAQALAQTRQQALEAAEKASGDLEARLQRSQETAKSVLQTLKDRAAQLDAVKKEKVSAEEERDAAKAESDQLRARLDAAEKAESDAAAAAAANAPVPSEMNPQASTLSTADATIKPEEGVEDAAARDDDVADADQPVVVDDVASSVSAADGGVEDVAAATPAGNEVDDDPSPEDEAPPENAEDGDEGDDDADEDDDADLFGGGVAAASSSASSAADEVEEPATPVENDDAEAEAEADSENGDSVEEEEAGDGDDEEGDDADAEEDVDGDGDDDDDDDGGDADGDDDADDDEAVVVDEDNDDDGAEGYADEDDVQDAAEDAHAAADEEVAADDDDDVHDVASASHASAGDEAAASSESRSTPQKENTNDGATDDAEEPGSPFTSLFA